jgi:hypothetical protein
MALEPEEPERAWPSNQKEGKLPSSAVLLPPVQPDSIFSPIIFFSQIVRSKGDNPKKRLVLELISPHSRGIFECV